MITDVLYSVNMYILFCVKRSELSHVMDIAQYKCYVLLLCGNFRTSCTLFRLDR